ncbi:hypothetical protein DF047_23980 [Burkholderia cenocepacia]|nr:hypothetical protein DF047_23980 [Burkholderia cenocepacia]
MRVAFTRPTNRAALSWRNVCALSGECQEVGAATVDRRVARRAGHSSVSVVSVREHGERH